MNPMASSGPHFRPHRPTVKPDRWRNGLSTGIMTAGKSQGGAYMPAVNREQIAADWASRGFSCDLWTDPPGQRWKDFRHATDELVAMLEGQMDFEVAGQVYHLQ